MNVLPEHKRVLIFKCRTEGLSIRATARIAYVSTCLVYQDKVLRDLPAGESKWTRYGSSSAPSGRTPPTRSIPRVSPATCGPGWRHLRGHPLGSFLALGNDRLG